MRRISDCAEPARRRADRPAEAIVPTSTAATSSSTVVSMSSRESIVSDRYGWVWKKSNETTAASAVTIPADPAAERGDGDDDDHQHEGGVGRAEERADRRHHGADADRRRDADDDTDRQTGAIDRRRVGVARCHRRSRNHQRDGATSAFTPP